jgi:zinc D-Ala-D-Ala dipeptidase
MKRLVGILIAICATTCAQGYTSIREVPIMENGEPLVDLVDQAVIAYAPSYLAQYPGCTKIRKTVYEMLCKAQRLLPKGVFFELNVGLRSLKVQAELFEKMCESIEMKFPQLSEKERFMEASKFTAPVKTWEGVPNIPPHSTGGAIDIILIDGSGHSLEMGDDPNDPYNEEIIKTDSPHISAEARKNREIMGKALSEVGFVNYPGEYWHWSYGDRRWAFVSDVEYSIYGSITE